MSRKMFVSNILILALVTAAQAQDQSPPSNVEAALGTIFSPRRAPGERKMGLLQRSFLDLVEASQPRLEIALVVDGTQSMGSELQGLQKILGQMVADLHRHRQDNVFFQLVVFRDAGAQDGEVVFPLRLSDHRFTNEIELLQTAIKGIRQETGAPYFPELIDLGVSEAITKLDWSTDEKTTRWILLFGDAPPFEEGFAEEQTRARRRVSTRQLTATANRKSININCILCQSAPESAAAFDRVLDQTRSFFNELATETNGLMLDLSFSDIREAVQKAAAAEPVGYQRIGKITQEDIDAERERAKKNRLTLSENVRMKAAVLPHMPLDRISFDPTRDEVQYAAELRFRLRSLPSADLKSPRLVEQQLEFLKARGVRGPALLQTLGSALNVDYVVWGSFEREGDTLKVQSAFYDVTSGEPLAVEILRTSEELPITQLCGQMATNMIERAADGQTNQQLAASFNRVTPTQRSTLIVPVALNRTARRNLLVGLEALEQALSFAPGEAPAQRLLEQAQAALEQAIKDDSTNPMPYWLLANCCYNLAQSAAAKQQPAAAAKLRAASSNALNNAYRFRNETALEYVRREIEADYFLLYSKDFASAIEAYKELAQAKAGASLRGALRAHWMLAGIYSGDWEIEKESEQLINPGTAREHLIQILAHWGESTEAAFIRKNLRWDEDNAENKFEHFPRSRQLQAPREA